MINGDSRQPFGRLRTSIHRAASLDCCQPAVNISVEERIYQGQLVFLVTVPYQYQEMFSTEGRVLVRRGTENISAAPHEITALASRRGRLRYEAEVPEGATIDDLDLDLLDSPSTSSGQGSELLIKRSGDGALSCPIWAC